MGFQTRRRISSIVLQPRKAETPTVGPVEKRGWGFRHRLLLSSLQVPFLTQMGEEAGFFLLSNDFYFPARTSSNISIIV